MDIINKVASSSLVTIDLEQWLLPADQIIGFDIKNYLLHEFVLQEKPFREALKQHDWQPYSQMNVGLHCSNDAIVPRWAYMLVCTYLQPRAKKIVFGDLERVQHILLDEHIEGIDFEVYKGKKVVVKGCSNLPISTSAYIKITQCLLPFAQSMMYGEPCSTVPIFKKL